MAESAVKSGKFDTRCSDATSALKFATFLHIFNHLASLATKESLNLGTSFLSNQAKNLRGQRLHACCFDNVSMRRLAGTPMRMI